MEAKRALSREEQHASSRSENFNSGRGSGGVGNFRTNKIFVGGLPPTLMEDAFRQYFQSSVNIFKVMVTYVMWY